MKIVYTFLFSIFSFVAFADGMHISGIIKDMDSGQPVKNAFVLITFSKGFEFSDRTDSLGKYEIKTNVEVPEGYYGIEIEANDYYKPNGFIHVTKNCTFNFTLKSKLPQPLTMLPSKTDSLKPEPLKLALDGYASNNLIFLIDISSSMNVPEKMPLLKEAMKYLVNELRSTDKVAILTFSNTVKEVLASTSVSDRQMINKIIDELAFGSTSQGGAALDIAYKTAQKNFIPNGNNRIVLASDGIFTAGEKDYKKMQQVIEKGKEKNITMSVFCFGKNTEYVNTKLKKLTILGKGNYANISNLTEAKQFMLEEAKAVKEKQ